MVKNDTHQFDTWMCMRDWNPEEQRMCGLGPHELGCFNFEVCAATSLPDRGEHCPHLAKSSDQSCGQTGALLARKLTCTGCFH